MARYIIRGGIEGKKRLEVLARVMWPTTSCLLEEAGVVPGMNCLDLGCGGGDVTVQLAALTGPHGRVTGVDMDAIKLELAQRNATQDGLENVEFRKLKVQDWIEESQYDCVYSRFLLSHLTDPLQVLHRMLRAVRPGGLALLEDIDFGGHFCEPRCQAFDTYARLYRLAAKKQGADPDIGPKLYGMMLDAGWQDVHVKVVQPIFTSGEGKQMAVLTLTNIADSLLDEKITTATELRCAIDDLTRFSDDPRTLISLPRIFQLWGRRIR